MAIASLFSSTSFKGIFKTRALAAYRISGIKNQPDIRYPAKYVSGPTLFKTNGTLNVNEFIISFRSLFLVLFNTIRTF